ncbi:SCO family protein [Rurimicrobium arvi]|uniref:SCO family protein n=1 Tax=Rurimicrobium arvi TaxID=2049916 RepID=A0ABP8MIF5_9BACT
MEPVNEKLPYYNTPDFTPHFLHDADSVNKEITHRTGDFSLTDENGAPITADISKGKIQVADFIFTTCGSICPKMTDQMKKVADAFANDSSLVILSFSVTPWIDSPAQLRAYRKAKGITQPFWHFITGSKSAIYSLARQSYFAEEELGFTRDSTEFLHTEHFILTDKNRRIRGIYNGTLTPEVQQLIKDIRQLQSEE